MKLYYSPLACSLASRIAFYESGLQARFIEVSLVAKRLADDSDYFAVAEKGQVPALQLENGEILTEGPAVLQYIGDLNPSASLTPPPGTFQRYRLQEWLNYLSTELHKAVFAVVFDPNSPEAARTYALGTVPSKFDYLSRQLAGRDFLLRDFSVADAYLFTILNWTYGAQISLKRWPTLHDYYERIRHRPKVRAAWSEEMRLAGRV